MNRISRSVKPLSRSLGNEFFQRRLASSTYALLRSFERRQQKVISSVEAMRSAKLRTTHQTLDTMGDIFDAKTANEEERTGDG